MAGLRAANARLCEVIEAKDAQPAEAAQAAVEAAGRGSPRSAVVDARRLAHARRTQGAVKAVICPGALGAVNGCGRAGMRNTQRRRPTHSR